MSAFGGTVDAVRRAARAALGASGTAELGAIQAECRRLRDEAQRYAAQAVEAAMAARTAAAMRGVRDGRGVGLEDDLETLDTP